MDILRRLVIRKRPFHQEEADQKTIDESGTEMGERTSAAANIGY